MMNTQYLTDLLPLLCLGLVTFMLAGFVKGVVGLGLPTVAVGLLGLAMPTAQAAALLIVPSLVTNVWQLLAGPRFAALARRLWPMLAGICVGTWAGGGWLANGGHLAGMALGIALLAYAALGLAAVRLHVPKHWSAAHVSALGGGIGVATGLVTAATGVFVIPAVPFLQALDLERDDLVQALGLSFTVSTVALAAGLARDGIFHGHAMGVSLLALAPALGGMYFGQWVRGRVSATAFRRCFFVGLAMLGAELVIQHLR
ncbi:sulfite exporter TauE/SafE family protein [Pandoraea terrigena]|uniref:Probable membrane transporter protein n=1 Tax=Pandoraea terrigena TaxID=2508292 RepID=A0A5E4V909_9BURK|nr:sulfite exporter TauE/SafE family protein [Pandoraea terrigena]VVE07879.1 sulfite exporter TauE/SafE family protein [Pandoraea terrigena]